MCGTSSTETKRATVFYAGRPSFLRFEQPLNNRTKSDLDENADATSVVILLKTLCG